MANKPPFNARYTGECEACKRLVNIGDEVVWGRARGAVVHVTCAAPASQNHSSQTDSRSSDDGSTGLEKTAFRLFEQLCANPVTGDWDEQMLAGRAFKLAEAFYKERARRRKSELDLADR
jgi:hypothetical protein